MVTLPIVDSTGNPICTRWARGWPNSNWTSVRASQELRKGSNPSVRRESSWSTLLSRCVSVPHIPRVRLIELPTRAVSNLRNGQSWRPKPNFWSPIEDELNDKKREYQWKSVLFLETNVPTSQPKRSHPHCGV